MKAVLGIGSNLGNREKNMAAAITGLEQLEGTQVLALSNLYETAPFDVLSPQDAYLNCCVLLETQLEPLALLAQCQEIENRLGRERKEYHGARTMDIDVLLCENFTLSTPTLTVPHPGMGGRAFVLVPLSDLFPTKEALGWAFGEAYEKVDKEQVWLYK